MSNLLSFKTRLIVGLGNPGTEYENTRHNAGAWFVEALAKQYDATFCFEKKYDGLIAKLVGPCFSYWLLKPLTYMNCSGKSVAALTRFYRIPSESILVAHDELSFKPGIIRLKQAGSHAGHNGVRDIIASLKTDHFLRLRIGVGRPASRQFSVASYLLSIPSQAEQKKVCDSIEKSLCIVPDLLAGDLDRAYRELHVSHHD